MNLQFERIQKLRETAQENPKHKVRLQTRDEPKDPKNLKALPGSMVGQMTTTNPQSRTEVDDMFCTRAPHSSHWPRIRGAARRRVNMFENISCLPRHIWALRNPMQSLPSLLGHGPEWSPRYMAPT